MSNDTVDTDTHCPVCGRENRRYADGLTNDRYDGCEDEREEAEENDGRRGETMKRLYGLASDAGCRIGDSLQMTVYEKLEEREQAIAELSTIWPEGRFLRFEVDAQ